MIIGNGEIFAYSAETENPAGTAYLLVFASYLRIQQFSAGQMADGDERLDQGKEEKQG